MDEIANRVIGEGKEPDSKNLIMQMNMGKKLQNSWENSSNEVI